MMPYLRESEIAELRALLRAIRDCKNIEDAHSIAGRALELLESLERKKGGG